MAAAARARTDASHIPVLLDAILEACAPIRGLWLDGTFGAGGYARGLLAAGADRVIGVDRDPMVFEMAADWAAGYGDRLVLVEGTFSDLDTYADALLDGIVLDLGVSSMQLDQAERGFSFMADGPLDMRMSQTGPSAADLVADASEADLADILYHYGEERGARSIARAIGMRSASTVRCSRLYSICNATIGTPPRCCASYCACTQTHAGWSLNPTYRTFPLRTRSSSVRISSSIGVWRSQKWAQ